MTARLSIVLGVHSLLWISSVGLADDEQLDKYKHIWAATRPRVESGIIHYKQFNGGDFKSREHDEVRALLKKLSEGRDDYPNILRDLACKLSGVEVPVNPPEYPEQILYYDGKRMRYERYGGIEISNGDLSTKARHVKVNDPSMQINIVDKHAPVHTQMDGLWEVYRMPSAELASKLSVASSHAESDIILDASVVIGFTMIVSKNGDILEIRTGDSRGGGVEWVYSAFKEFDGVRLPQLTFKATYNDGKLAFASISAIADANFSVKIEDSVFVQDVKAGDIIVDSRNGKQAVTRAKHDADNVFNTRAWSKSD